MNHERNPHPSLEVGPLGAKVGVVVVPGEICAAVVAGQNDDRVVELLCLVKAFQNPTDGVVELVEQGFVFSFGRIWKQTAISFCGFDRRMGCEERVIDEPGARGIRPLDQFDRVICKQIGQMSLEGPPGLVVCL